MWKDIYELDNRFGLQCDFILLLLRVSTEFDKSTCTPFLQSYLPRKSLIHSVQGFKLPSEAEGVSICGMT